MDKVEQAARALLEAIQPQNVPIAMTLGAYYDRIWERAEALRAALAEHGWQPIETAPKGRKVIAGYWNSAGKWRTVMACYYLEGTLDCETNDSGWAPEGWYEESETHEDIMPCDCEPTYWHALFEPPVLAAAEKEPKNG